MAAILYAPKKKKIRDDLFRIIQNAIPAQDIEMYSSITDLLKRLQRPMLDVSVAVLYASERSDLMEMIYLDDLLGELGVVLILPDGKPDMLEKAHVLHPRFIVAAESDFSHLGGVLKKMTDRYNKTHRAAAGSVPHKCYS